MKNPQGKIPASSDTLPPHNHPGGGEGEGEEGGEGAGPSSSWDSE